MPKGKTQNKLYRVEKGKVLGGVATGFGEFFDIDPVIVRLFFLTMILFGGSGTVIYLFLWIFVPTKKTSKLNSDEYIKKNAEEIKGKAEKFVESVKNSSDGSNMRLIGGLTLIAFGSVFLLNNFGIWQVDYGIFWAVIIILMGVAMLTRK